MFFCSLNTAVPLHFGPPPTIQGFHPITAVKWAKLLCQPASLRFILISLLIGLQNSLLANIDLCCSAPLRWYAEFCLCRHLHVLIRYLCSYRSTSSSPPGHAMFHFICNKVRVPIQAPFVFIGVCIWLRFTPIVYSTSAFKPQTLSSWNCIGDLSLWGCHGDQLSHPLLCSGFEIHLLTSACLHVSCPFRYSSLLALWLVMLEYPSWQYLPVVAQWLNHSGYVHTAAEYGSVNTQFGI